ncbi:MAG TPA: hypothetical protein VGR03_09425 [Candidatus Acidoferrum sp.]|nr:hypothetical protein [Candidatus Acidoferrum sp.]
MRVKTIQLSLAIPILLFAFAGCEVNDNGPKISAGSGKQSGWRAHCARELGFLIYYPPEMELKVEPSKITAEEQFNLSEWRVPGSEWFVVLHVHESPPEGRTPSLREWLQDLGGDQAEATLAGDIPAVLTTSLFEAVFEKSVFFVEKSSRRLVEIRLIVPNIADWMGPAERVAPQYRSQERIFDYMVDSIHVGKCP